MDGRGALAGFSAHRYWCVRVRSLREMLCGFSHRAGHESLTYLPRISEYSYVTLSRMEERERELNVPTRVSLAPARAPASPSVGGGMYADWTWRGMSVGHAEECAPKCKPRVHDFLR